MSRRDPILLLLILFASLIFLLILALLGLKSLRLPEYGEEGPPRQAMDLRWVSYGDSITENGRWQPLVLDRYPFLHLDQGISGSCVAGRSPQAFWNEERIREMVAAKPDLITLMGGINDYFSSCPLGEPEEMEKAVDEKDIDSFFGAYSFLVERLRSELPNCKLFIMSTSAVYTRFTGETNSLGLRIDDYAEASRNIATFYGLNLIDTAAIPYDEAEFMADHTDGVHPNPEGAKKIAALVEAAFRENLNLLEMPD